MAIGVCEQNFGLQVLGQMVALVLVSYLARKELAELSELRGDKEIPGVTSDNLSASLRILPKSEPPAEL